MAIVLFTTVVTTLFVIMIGMSFFDMLRSKIPGACVIGLWMGMLISYLFAPSILGVKLPFKNYVEVFFLSLTDTATDPIYGQTIVANVLICGLLGLVCGGALGGFFNIQEKQEKD